jgi:hypothetical protein
MFGGLMGLMFGGLMIEISNPLAVKYFFYDSYKI